MVGMPRIFLPFPVILTNESLKKEEFVENVTQVEANEFDEAHVRGEC